MLLFFSFLFWPDFDKVPLRNVLVVQRVKSFLAPTTSRVFTDKDVRVPSFPFQSSRSWAVQKYFIDTFETILESGTESNNLYVNSAHFVSFCFDICASSHGAVPGIQIRPSLPAHQDRRMPGSAPRNGGVGSGNRHYGITLWPFGQC